MKLSQVGFAGVLMVSGLISAEPPAPPVAKRVDHVQTWHGRKFTDPYFWMRKKGSPEVEAHLKAENAYTEAMTRDQVTLREKLYQEMLGRLKQTDLTVPVFDRGYHYYSRTEEGKQYPIHCRCKGSMEAAEEVFLDLNEMGRGLPFIALGDRAISRDQQLLAYTVDTAGFRQYRLHLKDLATGRNLPDTAERVTSLAWANDGRTLFYVTEDPVTKRSNQVWRLAVGQRPVRVFEEKDEHFALELSGTRDDRFLLLRIASTDTWEFRTLDADRPMGVFKPVLARKKGHKYSVEHREGRFFLRTNLEARNFRVVTAPVEDPSPVRWTEFVPARPGILVEDVELFKTHAVVLERHEGAEIFRVHDFATGQWRTIPMQDAVHCAYPGETPDFQAKAWRFSYESPVTPRRVYDYDFATGELRLLKQQEVPGGFDPAHYETRRVWAPARDGVRIPVTLLTRKGQPQDGTAPLFLYGYGSYGFGESDNFSTTVLSLVDRGMVHAVAHVRGGNELGETWHDDGMLMKKKNSFFDFIDCAEFLVKEKWGARDRLVAEGGSAGGLLMGAVVNLRPDLFKVVHAAVPFLDVMNSMMDASLPLTVGEYLEWGNPNQKAAFDYMLSYSPYDNLKQGAYPAMLVTTSYNDSQVMYWEPAKYVAKLRTLKTDANPLLLKCRMEPSGHGGASGRYDQLRESAFEFAWMLTQVGITK